MRLAWCGLIATNRVGGWPLIDQPTSHTTVHTVRYTAVPKFTQLLADNNHKNWDILPASDGHSTGFSVGLGYGRFANSLFLCLPTSMPILHPVPVSWDWQNAFLFSSSVSRQPSGSGFSSIRPAVWVSFSYPPAWNNWPSPARFAAVFLFVSEFPSHYCGQ